VDYDKDGHLDLFVANYVDLDLSRTPTAGSGKYCLWKGVQVMCGPRGLPGSTNLLYHNNGDGTFTDVTEKAGILNTFGHYAFTALSGDFDNDGRPDKEPKIVYRNLRNGRFEDVSSRAGSGVALLRSARGVAFADFDNDGDIDIVINNVNDAPTLLRNDGGNKNRWLKIKMVGTRSNRSGIGTRVKVVAGGHSQIDEVRSGGSYISQNDLRLHFGMGAANQAELVVVNWLSGQVDRLKDVGTNQVVWVKEGQGIVKQVGRGYRTKG